MVATAIHIRSADAEDLSNVYRLMLHWHENVGIEFPPVNPQTTIAWITNTMIGGRLIVADRAGRIVGALGLTETGFPWNVEARCLQSEFFFIRPEFRKKGVAAAMVEAAKAIGAARSMPLLMSVTSGTNVDKLDRFFGIKGGIYAGGNFVYGLPAVKGEDERGTIRQRQPAVDSQAA